jgi:GST-like protein
VADYVLYERAGWGSAIVEAQLAWYGLPHRLETVDDLFASAEARDLLTPLNPVAQVPTLVLPNGAVMTESAAITLHLADAAGSDALVPGRSAPERPAFLRWLVFLVANIYPTFTYADDPTRFVPGDAAPAFRRNVDAYALRLWSALEAAAAGPHFLGTRFSALDVYLAVMTRWRPKRAWFAANAPKLSGAAQAAEDDQRIQQILRRNFPDAFSG